MPYLTIENFKYGLDSRRGELTSQAGVLSVCENGHVNQGGEIDKRKAFVLDQVLGINDSNSDFAVFGLEVTSVGKTVFGSALPSSKGYVSGSGVATITLTGGGSGCTLNVTVVNGVITAVAVNAGGSGYSANDYITVVSASGTGALIKVATVSGSAAATVTLIRGQQQGQPVLVSAMPAGYTYQQLQHPAITDAFTIDGKYGDASVATTVALGRGYHGYDTISDGGVADLGTADAVNYDRTKHRMTKVTFSNSFNGVAFVCAVFADGINVLFRNGVAVNQSYMGTMISSYSTKRAQTAAIGYQIEKQIKAELTGWSADSNPSSTTLPYGLPRLSVAANYAPCRIGVAAGGGGDPIGVGGFITTRNLAQYANVTVQGFAQPASTIAATAAPTATFTVAKASGTPQYNVSAVINDPNTGSTAGSDAYYRIMALVTWAVSDANTAGLIVTAINALTATTGFSAASGGGAVVVVTGPLPASPLIGSFNLVNLSFSVILGSGTDSNTGTKPWTTGFYTHAFGQTAMVTVDSVVSSPGFLVGDTWSFSIVHATQGNITLGKGNIAGQIFVNGVKYGSRQFLAFGSTFAFSAINNPAGWEQQNTGAGSVNFESQYGNVDTVQAFSPYQGRLAVFGVYSIQIWTAPSDPTQFVRNQILQNIGTDAPFSVVPFGELDVFFRGLSGIRSLRVRDSSLNGYVTDIGSPIDGFLVPNNAAARQASVGVLEPNDHRYWLYENGVIYTLSYFPTLKISAWSTYVPSYDLTTVIVPAGGSNYDSTGRGLTLTLTNGVVYSWTPGANEVALTVGGVSYQAAASFLYSAGQTVSLQGVPNTSYTGSLISHVQTTFTPEKFVVFNGQVFVRDTSGNVFQYGGTNNQTFDYCVCTVETPWLDVKNKVSTKKQSTGIDAVTSGSGVVTNSSWDLFASMDYLTNVSPVTMKQLKVADNLSSPDQGVLPFRATGTHVKLRAKTSVVKAEAATLSALVWHYNDAGEKKS